MGSKVGTRLKIMVANIGEVENGDIGRLTKINIFLPMIVNDQKTQLGKKEVKPRKCSQGSSTRLKGTTKC